MPTMTLEDFDNISRSPKGKGGSGRKRQLEETQRTPKKTKGYPPDLNTTETKLNMAEIKRKAIRACNDALKIVRPLKDNERYIYYSCRNIGRALYFGPAQPYSFYRIMATFFPELATLTDDEKVLQVMTKLSRFVLKNMDWTEVNKCLLISRRIICTHSHSLVIVILTSQIFTCAI